MPGPDPHALWIDDESDRPSVVFQAYSRTGNNGNRKARAIALLRRLSRGDWVCRWCRDPLPDYLRVDARFCGEGCRKRAARLRRSRR